MTMQSNAVADILGFTFIDMNNVNQEVGANKKYQNPKSDLNMFVSGGLDNKVHIRVVDNNGKEWINSTSDLIGASDRLTFAGEDHYGKVIALDANLPDGTYTFTQRLLNNANAELKTSILTYVYDRVPPVTSNELAFAVKSWGGGSVELFNLRASRELSLGGLSDELSGLSHAKIFAITSGVRNEFDVTLDPDAGSVAWLSRGGLFNAERADYNWGFDVYDAAGNKGTFSRTSQYDNVCPTLEISHVYNPNTSSWEGYTPNMIAWENPTRYRVRTPKNGNSVVNNSNFGYTWTPSFIDDTYAYTEKSTFHPLSSSYSVFYTKAGYCTTWHQSRLNVKLADSVELGPQTAGIIHRISIEGGEAKWVLNGSPLNNKPYVIDRVRQHVKARSYVQKLTISGSGGKCDVLAGETYCDIVTNYSVASSDAISNRGYAPRATYITSPDYTVHTGYLYEVWDLTKPTINKAVITNNQVDFNVIDQDKSNDWRSWWDISSVRVEATNNIDNTKIDLSLLKKETLAFNSWDYSFTLKTLATGDYSVTVHVIDKRGNNASQLIDSNYHRDSTPPAVDIQNKNLSVFSHIQGLDDLRIVATDDYSNIVIKSVKIKGGPINDEVNILSRHIEGDFYGLEYPRMFPALLEDEKYTLTVVASDEMDNTTVVVRSFTYIPKNYLDVGVIPVIAVNKPIEDINGKVLTRVTSGVLRTSEAQLATGEQEVFFTLRGDSTISVIIQGVVIAPGETKIIFVDVTSTNSALDVPVYPAINGEEGIVKFLLEIPVIKSTI